MRQAAFLLAVSLIASLSAVVQFQRFGDTFLQGDSDFYAFTAESLLADGDFDLANQMRIEKRDDLKHYEGFFAVSPQGRIVPKHSTLLPIVTVPFLAAFGKAGFLIANIIIAIMLVAGVARLGGNSTQAKIIALLLFLTSSWLGYCFNYSPDLFLAALITWSYAFAIQKKWFLCGLLAGLAVWAKVYAALILLPIAILILPFGIWPIVLTAAASLVGIVPMLVINHQLYGGPFVTGYDRDARVDGDSFRLTEHYSRFNQPPVPGLVNVLFDAHTGMIRTAPLWFLWPAGLLFSKNKRIAVALALGAIINVLFFAPYDEWNASTGGNRFLFPSVALGGALLTPILERYWPRQARDLA